MAWSPAGPVCQAVRGPSRTSARPASNSQVRSRPGGLGTGSAPDSHVDRSTRTAAAVHRRCVLPRGAPAGCPFVRVDVCGHLSGHRYPGRDRRLELSGHVRGRHGKPRHVHQRTQHFDVGQRHLADRFTDDRRDRRASRLLRTRIGHRECHRADHVGIPLGTRVMPPGTQPPVVLQFNASNAPVAQLTLSGTATEQQLFDWGLNFLRIRLFTVPGLSTPAPYGGKQREVMVQVDPARAQANGLSPQDIVDAVLRQNVILPAGTARFGDTDYDILINGSPGSTEEFNKLPIKLVNGSSGRASGPGCDAFHLHRVRPGDPPHRSCEVSVLSARTRGHLLDARVVFALAHPRSDPCVDAPDPREAGRRTLRGRTRAANGLLDARRLLEASGLEALLQVYAWLLAAALGRKKIVLGLAAAFRRCVRTAIHACWTRFFFLGRFRADAVSLPSTQRFAHRAYGAARRRGRAEDT